MTHPIPPAAAAGDAKGRGRHGKTAAGRNQHAVFRATAGRRFHRKPTPAQDQHVKTIHGAMQFNQRSQREAAQISSNRRADVNVRPERPAR